MLNMDLIDIYKLFLKNIPLPIWIETVESNIVFLNKAYEKMFHVEFEKVKGKKNKEAFEKETAKTYNDQIQKCLDKGCVHISNDVIHGVIAECYMFPIVSEEKEIIGVAGIIININDRKERELEIEKQKNILRTIIDAVPEAIFYKDENSRFIGYNKQFKEFYESRGVTQLLGKTDAEIYPDSVAAAQFIEQDKEILKTKKSKYFEHKRRDEKGNEVIEENLKIPVIDRQGQAWGVVGLSRNITERKKIEEKLRYLSEIDMLTGLYNRYSFEEKVKELDYEKYHPLGIIMGDVNGLKLVNDTLGHLEGDKLLKNIAEVLKASCNEGDYIFRWGGDEFIILLPNCYERQCEKVISRITDNCNARDSKLIQLNIALGETVKTNLSEDIYECIRKVEDKVYRQKLIQSKSIKHEILDSLRKSLEEKNIEVEGHLERVVSHALKIGEHLKFKTSDLDELTLVAQLHDIGKIGIPEDILLKPTKLTREEFEIVKTHSEKGYRIINASSELVNVSKCVLTHHEKWNGKGYPLGLKGKEIPLMARIINVVDAYDVMTHKKVYKEAITKEEAIKELKKHKGIQFDPYIVDIFIGLMEREQK